MKKRAALLALSAITLAAAAAGCGRGDGQVKDNNTGMAGTEDAIDHTGTEAASFSLGTRWRFRSALTVSLRKPTPMSVWSGLLRLTVMFRKKSMGMCAIIIIM